MTEEKKEEEKKEETKTEEAPKEEKKETKTEEDPKKKTEEPKETKKEAPTPAKSEAGVPTASVGKEKKAPSGKFKDLIKQIESLSAIELAELVKELEERFGVSAAAPVAVVGGEAAAPGSGDAQAEEKSSYTVVLSASGDQKINVIKALREINQELGLKEAKDLADNPPKEIKKDVPKEEAEEAKKKIEAAGGNVELK